MQPWEAGEHVEGGLAKGEGGDTHIVEINVYATKMCENKVANGVGALNGLRVVVKGGEEPGILGCNQLA